MRVRRSETFWRVRVREREARWRGSLEPGGSTRFQLAHYIVEMGLLCCLPPRSESRTNPLSRAISSTSGRGLPLSTPVTPFIRSLSFLPRLTVHLFNRVLLSVPSSASSGPWYGKVRRRFRGGALDLVCASGGGVGGLR